VQRFFLAQALPSVRPLRYRIGMNITLTINGTRQALEAEPRTLLVELLRDGLALTGTHIGCETSQCGACTLLLDGVAVKACTMLAVQADGRSITTIEGLASGDELHPMQAAFKDNHGLQCGFCTPGMVMAGIDMVRRRGPVLNEDQVMQDLEGNLCRCTGYRNIIAAIVDGAARMGAA
jgi:aerobic carbon-monoxide dehydrogenase small subunit